MGILVFYRKDLPQGPQQHAEPSCDRLRHTNRACGGHRAHGWVVRQSSLEERNLVQVRDKRTFWEQGWKGKLKLLV